MKYTINVGDRVVRKPSEDTPELTMGKTYTVSEVLPNHNPPQIRLVEIPTLLFNSKFFDFFNVNDTISKMKNDLKKLIQERDDNLIAVHTVKGFIVGANIQPIGHVSCYNITSIFVVDDTNFSKFSGKVHSKYSSNPAPFVAITFGSGSSMPIDEIALAPKVFKLHGYEMKPYVKGSDLVEFGCAKIRVDLLKAIRDNNLAGCRKVERIRLCSDKEITAVAIVEILDFIKE